MAYKIHFGIPSRSSARRTRRRGSTALLTVLVVGILAALGWLQFQNPGPAAAIPATTSEAASPGTESATPTAQEPSRFRLFQPFWDEKFVLGEQIALVTNVFIALLGLLYALWLVGEVKNADQGTPRMQEIARAVREGANAYLGRQFRVVGVLIVVITLLLYFAAKAGASAEAIASGQAEAIALGRAIAFLVGSTFSATVGFVGMRMATVGNLRVAAAAKTSFGRALQLGYRTGTITGMLTDGLGLFGGSVIFLIYGEHAYEALLGFGFGGTLLALFMRVGGGIYTKAADVGADLVGKLEAGIPEDDPRNAATIADNVGDNVGDCAGMAADIFESYEVTIVAAMILGIASFGHKGVIFPLLVRAIGVLGSIVSTYTVRAGEKGSVAAAMGSVNRAFVLGSTWSVIGFILLGLIYLQFTPGYLTDYPQSVAGFPTVMQEYKVKPDASDQPVDIETGKRVTVQEWEKMSGKKWEQERIAKQLPVPFKVEKRVEDGRETQKVALDANGEPVRLSRNENGEVIQDTRVLPRGEWSELHDPNLLPVWANFGMKGLDMRPAWTCLIGIILAVFLNKCTEYYTGTEYAPVKSLAKSCQTGHATNIIQGLAVGYESTVAAVIIIAAAIMASVLIYAGTTPTFIAFGVAMCGIGMLTLTGNTISMDVFGPVADNANGIGEMGYDKAEMGEEQYKVARQTLADLDAVGNTTKAITKGIAIGSAVIAAVSLFNSFIVSVGSAGAGEMARISKDVYDKVSSMITISDPTLFIGMLIGGAVPFLFSSMTIRAVGRAAFLIVKEVRLQFRDKAIWDGTKKPDYGRVVDICTTEAQKELIGPGLLAILMPVLVGFVLGPIALAGYLGGMIVTGQLLAVFMANAGGAWDNAKKTIEDEPRNPEANTGKGSERHKAAITGDTVGDPLKDTAGPAINPLIKVMNMVSLLSIPLILPYSHTVLDELRKLGVKVTEKPLDALFWGVVVVGIVGLVWAVWQSKRETPETRE